MPGYSDFNFCDTKEHFKKVFTLERKSKIEPAQKMFYLITSIISLAAFLTTVVFSFSKKQNKKSLLGQHVLISGGSSGIGLSVAHEVLKQGANVTLLARSESKLKSAEEELKKTKELLPDIVTGKVKSISVDVGASRKTIAEAVHSSESNFGPVFMVVNCAGFAKAAKFEDLPEDTVRSMMDVNYMGSFFLTQEVVRSMKKAETEGIIVFVSSQGGLFGIFGFTAYAAAKGAVVKLAEALHMEMKPHNISVTVSFPPDTDTPGFEEENKSKPTETRLISESAGLYKPEEVARSLINDALHGKFCSSVGFEGFMLTTLCAGMSPVTDFLSLFCQVCFTGLFRFISAFYLWNFGTIVTKEHEAKLKSKKLE